MFKDRLIDFYYDTRDFIGRHKKVVMPVLLLICVLITVGLAFVMRRHAKEAAQESAAAATTGETAAEDVELEENAHEDVNALFQNYYRAVAEGDVDTIQSISADLSEEEKIRIQELSGYIDSYTTVDVYTKTGPVEGSYVAYVYTKLKLKDHEWEIPGLQTMYVCTRKDGSLYINNDETQPKSVSEYIQLVSVQDDVVDLNNQTSAEYNDLLASDADLADYLDQIASTIDISVGQQLAALNESRNQTDENTTYLKAKSDGINIRKSASAEGTRIGSAAAGDEFQLVEELDDGWSEIIFNGQSAYVKSEYFEKIEPQTSDSAGGSDSQDAGADASTDDSAGAVEVAAGEAESSSDATDGSSGTENSAN